MARISAIRTLRWQTQPNCLWVEIETDSGVVGLGETFYGAAAVEAIVHDMIAPLLLGKDPEDRTAHARDFFSCANFSGYAGAEMRAWSAVDIALWDLAGKLLERPIYGLLGGRVRESIGIYATCANAGSHPDQDGFLERPGDLARELLASGITAMKIWPFDRFAPQLAGGFATGPAGWSAMGPPGHAISPRDLAAGVRAFEEIRDAVGDEMSLILEGHSRWDVTTGIRILRALEHVDLLWAEDVIQPDSVDDLRRLVDETSVPQAVSERLITRHRYREVLEKRAAHVVMLDVAWTGGVTESAQIADLADLFHLPFAPHDCTGPVTALVNLHLCTARSNAMITEIVRGFVDGYYLDVLDMRLPISQGRGSAPTGPGLGAHLRDDFRSRSDVSTRQSTAP
jgi:L-alanine-DL-glutamate epimerase-like enolase superfamily enzyme